MRVSAVMGRGDDLISPELQMTAIEDHCARNGYALDPAAIEALDESGSSRRSKWWRRLDEAIELVEAGAVDVIVMWKYSRAARNRMRWAVAVDRVESAGGRIESATEPIDTTTAAGRFARGMLAEFNAFTAETIGETWREVHARRIRQGLPANSKARFGYEVVDGVHRPHEETGPILADLYRRYIAGESFFSLAAWLNGRGVRTVAGYSAKGPGPWSQIGLRQMLDTGFGAGLLTVKGSRQPGVHEPVIDLATWEAYRAARELRRPLRRIERSQYLLSGMVWCACGSKMGYGQWTSPSTERRYVQLRCASSTVPGGVRHRKDYVMATPVEAAVLEWLNGQAGDLNAAAADAITRRARTTRRRQDAKSLARQIIELDKALGRLTADRAKGLVPDAAYQPAIAELVREREQVEHRRLIAAAEAARGEPRQVAASLVQDWEILPIEQRREGLRRLIERVTVTGWNEPMRVAVVPR